MASPIPARTSSKYCGQYAGAIDAQRIADIFGESRQIALSSKNPDTANDRFALAVEAYHQLMAMGVGGEVRASFERAMQSLADTFPAQVLANEAQGLWEKARKLKTAKKRLELLKRAAEVADRGAREAGRADLSALASDLHAEIAELEAGGQ